MLKTREIIEAVLSPVISNCPGAGVGVAHAGQPVFSGGFGFANISKSIEFNENTIFRCCSITKQFSTLVLQLAVEEQRLKWSDHPSLYLPELDVGNSDITLSHLATNQSGIADYWCVAMLSGARAESHVRLKNSVEILSAINNLAFTPGSQFSYSNTNYLIIGLILEKVFKSTLAEIFKAKILAPLGMSHSFLAPRTSHALPGDTIGYEADAQNIWRPANVDIEWFGDAGLASTINDMLRWVAIFDGVGPTKLVNAAKKLVQPGQYLNGFRASYRYGIRCTYSNALEQQIHHGALRGWRMTLLRLPAEALSVVIMFNHMTDPGPVAIQLAERLLTRRSPPPPLSINRQSDWRYWYATQLKLVVETCTSGGGIWVKCGGRTDFLARLNTAECEVRSTSPDRVASHYISKCMGITLDILDNGARLNYIEDNIAFKMTTPESNASTTPTGDYINTNLKSTLRIRQSSDAKLTIEFEGPLGSSEVSPLLAIGDRLFIFHCTRALDYAPPGTFTVVVADESATLGCWAARNLIFTKL